MNRRISIVGFLVFACTSTSPSLGLDSPHGGHQMQPTVTVQTNRADIRSGNASLSLELKTQQTGASAVIVSDSSPAGFWPFMRGDVVRRIDDRPVVRPDDILFVFRESAGAEFKFEVSRNNQVTMFRAGPKDFAGLALPPSPEPPTPPPRGFRAPGSPPPPPPLPSAK